MKPYKVVPYDTDAADIIARDSGERVGYVLKMWGGWSGCLTSKPGAPVTEQLYRLRADAAEQVWAAAVAR